MRKETEKWWKQANRDLVSAKRIMELGEYHVCAFLSQQAV
jgi:HEPN domain-containing protein